MPADRDASAETPPPVWITAAVEGIVDEAVVRRLAADQGLRVAAVHAAGGKHQLDRRLRSYNAAAVHAPWVVLRDLDHDAACPAELVQKKLPDRNASLLLRVAVRSLEAWLLADRENLPAFLGVSASHLPPDPSSLERPKRTLVDLARRSKRPAIRVGLVPEPGLSSETGPGYSAYLIEFIHSRWSPAAAADRSESLRHCLAALSALSRAP